MQVSILTGLLAFAALALTTSAPARADAELQAFLEKAIAWLRDRDHDPAMAALIQIDDQIAAEAAIGARALGHSESVTVDDRWYIGSCTKAFTATLIGTLVDRHVMTLDDTLEASLPALAKTMNPAYRGVTVRQLLSHTAGLPPLNNTETEFPTARAVVKFVHGVTAQRLTLAHYYLDRPPASEVGKYNYSNLGYVIVAAIAELHTRQSWETLMREKVFEPLGMKHAGFGPPGRVGHYDAPLGHAETLDEFEPAPSSTDPPWLGPAGRISVSLNDWALFAQDQLDGATGHGKILQPATYRAIQTPVAENYALGWGVLLGPDQTPRILEHAGSDGYWFAEAVIYPEQKTIILMATNFGGASVARKSIEDLGTGLAKCLKIPK